MKSTRILLVFAAALSLGLAVFASVRTNRGAVTVAQSTIKVSDDTQPFVPGDDDGGGGGSDSGHLT